HEHASRQRHRWSPNLQRRVKVNRPIESARIMKNFYYLLLLMTTGQLVRANQDVTFISPDGSDTNDCSAAHLCRTLQTAHDRTNPNGIIVVVDSMLYAIDHSADYLTVNITKPITIDGGLGMGSEIQVPAGQAGIFINSGVGPVTIRNFTIKVSSTS